VSLRDGPGGEVPLRRLAARTDAVQDRFGLLLLLLVGSFVALGSAERPWARVVAGLLQFAALIVAFLSTRLFRSHRWLGLFAVVGIVAIVLAVTTNDVTAGIGAIAAAVVLTAVLVAVLDQALRHRQVSIQTLFGAVCAYFLIGLIFSSIYGMLDAFGPDPVFGATVAQSVYSYFSFTTLTTVGFGDYTAHTSLAQRLVVIEAVMGQVFIATTLARLVSLYKTKPTEGA
jgi:Ca2+/Na+ antiporter